MGTSGNLHGTLTANFDGQPFPSLAPLSPVGIICLHRKHVPVADGIRPIPRPVDDE
jgi:hypothetical protein